MRRLSHGEDYVLHKSHFKLSQGDIVAVMVGLKCAKISTEPARKSLKSNKTSKRQLEQLELDRLLIFVL